MRSPDHTTGLPHDGAWITSSRSGQSGQCVKACRTPHGAAVQDSKDHTSTTLTFSATAWQTFLGGLHHGRYRP